MTVAARTSETSVNFYLIRRHNMPEDKSTELMFWRDTTSEL
jgi:hypothetical protein